MLEFSPSIITWSRYSSKTVLLTCSLAFWLRTKHWRNTFENLSAGCMSTLSWTWRIGSKFNLQIRSTWLEGTKHNTQAKTKSGHVVSVHQISTLSWHPCSKNLKLGALYGLFPHLSYLFNRNFCLFFHMHPRTAMEAPVEHLTDNPGAIQTLGLIRKHFWWPSIAADILGFVTTNLFPERTSPGTTIASTWHPHWLLSHSLLITAKRQKWTSPNGLQGWRWVEDWNQLPKRSLLYLLIQFNHSPHPPGHLFIDFCSSIQYNHPSAPN